MLFSFAGGREALPYYVVDKSVLFRKVVAEDENPQHNPAGSVSAAAIPGLSRHQARMWVAVALHGYVDNLDALYAAMLVCSSAYMPTLGAML